MADTISLDPEVDATDEQAPASTEGSGAPELSSTADLSGSTPETPPAPTGSDRPRDASGKFVSGKAAATPATPEALASAPPTTAAASDTAPPTTEPPVLPATPVVASAQPFTFRANKQAYTIEGAVVEGDRLIIPAAMIPEVKKHLAAGVYWESNRRALETDTQRKVDEATTSLKAEAERNHTVALQLLDLVSDPQRLQSFVNDHGREFALLRRELLLEMRNSAAPVRPAPAQPTAGGQAGQDASAALAAAASQSLTDTIDDVVDQMYEGVFSAEDLAEAKQAMADRLPAYFVQHNAEWYLDTDKVKADLARSAKQVKAISEARAAAKAEIEKLQKAKAFNDTRTPSTSKTPPTVTAGNSPAPSAEPRTYANGDDWARSMGIAG